MRVFSTHSCLVAEIVKGRLEAGGALGDLVRRKILLVRGDPPLEAEGILVDLRGTTRRCKPTSFFG